jgi:hypothetical protein
MSTTMDQLVAEFPRGIQSMGLLVAFGLIGLAASIAGAVTSGSPETARTGLLLGPLLMRAAKTDIRPWL